MAKNKKNHKKDWIYVSIILAFVFILVAIFLIDWNKFTWGLSSEMKEKLDLYEDRLMECSSEISVISYSNEPAKFKNKLIECQRIVSEARIQINSWNRDKNSNEIKTAKLDYDSTDKFFDAYSMIIQVSEGDFYSTKEALTKLETSLNLINQAMDKISEIERDYSHTEYYERYFLSKESEIEESKKQIRDLKSEIEELLDYYENLECSSGYVLTDDYECYPQCGSANEYCEIGQCCNGKCYSSCPSGYYLATNCECYSY